MLKDMHNSIGIIVVVKSFASNCHHRLIRFRHEMECFPQLR